MSALEALAAQASLARKMRGTDTFDQCSSLQDEIAKAIMPKSPIAILAKFDAQQENAKKKAEEFETLQEQVRDAPERAFERNQAREEAVRLIEEALADGSEVELETLRKEFDPENVLNNFQELCCALTGGYPTLDLPEDDVVTPERVRETVQKAHGALKAWMEQGDARPAYERTIAAMDSLVEEAASKGISSIFTTFLMHPKKRRELEPSIRAIEDALTEELNVLCAADADAAQDSVLEAVKLAWATLTAFYERFLAFSIMRSKSAAMELGESLSRLKPGLLSPSTEDVQRLFKDLRSKTRKRKRLALDLEEAREDARRGTEQDHAEVVRLEGELSQIESVYKLDSELRRKRARLLRHTEEHYPELLSDRKWLESIDVTDPATQKLSELGLLLTNAKREDFQELADLAPSSGKSVLQVRDSDGRVSVLKSFHLAREEWSSRFYRQVTALAQLQSAYIVRIQGVFMQDAREGYILMPFYEGGDLATWIVDNPHADLGTRRRIAIGLLSGLHDLHLRGFVHCDVKPENVFLAKGLSPVLGDFDGVQSHNVTMTQPLQATFKYMAPELRHGNVDKVEPPVDMFSVGVVLADLFEDAEMSDATQSLISDLQSADPSQRPTALEALRHEAFQVEPVKVASCTICLDNCTVSEGVSCADGHFICKTCLGDSVRAAAEPQAHVKISQDGSMRCVTPDCNLLISGATIGAALPDEVFAALLKILREHFERDAAAEQERQVQQRVQTALQDYGEEFEVRNHLRIIQAEVLTLSCPRCKQAFVDFEGCCALECAACPCHFCAWCFEDTGNDTDACHRHVASCTSKPRTQTDPFFSSMDVVQRAWVKLRADRLQYYLRHKVANEATRDAVYEKLTPLLTPDIVGSNFIP
ncbi:Protein kinase, putative [Hondaea fermentalgiana]|uniref:Protein kinase, putative n=1 Tax=Hondaea fermentalgiana TaxID=2315210 RepID=A0A2R5GY77_9STRA|nr:Protein kinase, putative [Hondaea fermentalgiana]|eukprot:GBG34758.1 Protein kinase, putative [Hondaea fermentalgiana]